MFEAQVLYYLNQYLGQYVKGLDLQALRISVFKGDLELRNLQLKPEALNKLKLPITVKAGLLGSLRLKVPPPGALPSFQSTALFPACHLDFSHTDRLIALDRQVPWANLGAAPVIVEMDRILVLACPNTEFQSQKSNPEVHPASAQSPQGHHSPKPSNLSDSVVPPQSMHSLGAAKCSLPTVSGRSDY